MWPAVPYCCPPTPTQMIPVLLSSASALSQTLEIAVPSFTVPRCVVLSCGNVPLCFTKNSFSRRNCILHQKNGFWFSQFFLKELISNDYQFLHSAEEKNKISKILLLNNKLKQVKIRNLEPRSIRRWFELSWGYLDTCASRDFVLSWEDNVPSEEDILLVVVPLPTKTRKTWPRSNKFELCSKICWAKILK